MTTPLTDEQRELLSAYLDDEVTDAERQTCEQLLERDEAKQYLESLRATAALVTKHASVRAPVGLSGRVMSELKQDLKPAPGNVHQLPTLGWQAPLWAAAAVVIVSLAIMFGPSVFSPSQAPEQGVARGVLDNLPEEEPADTLTATPPAAEEMDRAGFRDSGGGGGRALEPGTDSRVGDLESASMTKLREAAKTRDDLAETEEKLADKPENTNGEEPQERYARRQPSKDDDNAPETNSGKKANDWGPADSAHGATPAGGSEKKGEARDGKSAPEPAAPAPPEEPARKVDEGRNDDANDGEEEKEALDAENNRKRSNELKKAKSASEADKREEGAAPSEQGLGAKADPTDAQDKPQAEDEAEPDAANATGKDRPAQQAALHIDIAEAATLQGQTDVLWISNLYGDAKLADDDGDIENVSVEIDRAKLDELVNALRKLSKDQGYGEVDSSVKVAEELRGAGDESRRISGYLPHADEPANAGKEAPQMVTVVIRLK